MGFSRPDYWSGQPFPSPADLPDPGSFAIKTILEENIGRTLSDINSSSIFFGLSPGVMEIKTKINKYDLIRLKSIFTAKEP